MKTPKTRNAGTMTEAAFKGMIISSLRKLSQMWKPSINVKNKQRVKRGIYKCEKCGKEAPWQSPAPPGKKRKIKNFAVDHKEPIINPIVGFEGYDSWIERCFIEEESGGLRLLCKQCHDEKTQTERLLAKKRKNEKNIVSKNNKN